MKLSNNKSTACLKIIMRFLIQTQARRVARTSSRLIAHYSTTTTLCRDFPPLSTWTAPLRAPRTPDMYRHNQSLAYPSRGGAAMLTPIYSSLTSVTFVFFALGLAETVIVNPSPFAITLSHLGLSYFFYLSCWFLALFFPFICSL